ncbi:uncharacterized protein Dvar_55160 [Desulfosarcina variabilis str. Montpellier]
MLNTERLTIGKIRETSANQSSHALSLLPPKTRRRWRMQKVFYQICAVSGNDSGSMVSFQALIAV